MTHEPAAAPSVLWKAFGVLAAFSREDRVLTLAEIARRSGLPKSTAHRVLAMLAETGAVEQGEGGYRLGLRMFSLGALSPEAGLREAAALVPDGQLLVETDAPFLTPHPHRGRANEPYCLPWTVRGLAHVRGVAAERVADSARRTAEAVFALPSAADAPSPGAGGARST